MSSGKGTAGSGNNPNTAGEGVPPIANDAPPAPLSRSRPSAPPSRPVPNPMFGSNNNTRTASTPTAGRSSTPGGSLASSRPTISMVPSRGRSTSGPGPAGTGAAAAGPSRMTFKPVIPQRRKPTEPAQIKTEPGSSNDLSGASSPSDPSSSSKSDRGGRGGGRGGRGSARGGARGGRQPIEMVASGPFSMGTGSTSKYERSKRMASSSAGGGLSMSGGDKWQGETEADNLRPAHASTGRGSSYRDPDKLREKEEYSDQEEEVEIVDLDDVGDLDTMAPRALPRMQEDEKKKKKKEAKKKAAREQSDRQKSTADSSAAAVKADPEDVEMAEQAALSAGDSTNGVSSVKKDNKKEEPTTISPDSTPSDTDSDGDEDRPRDGKVVDALDLSESEEEETMDDLVDDFFFDGDHQNHNLDTDHGGVDPSNRLYLFQFPQLFPTFKPPKDARPKSEQDVAQASASQPQASSPPSAVKSALSSSPPGSSNAAKARRSVAFAVGTTGGSGAPDRGTTSTSTSIKREHEDDSKAGAAAPSPSGSSSSSQSGRIGKLKVYRDGRVEMHFSRSRSSQKDKITTTTRRSHRRPLIMELTGGSQTSFLQDLAVLDPVKREAYILGEIQRKFVCSPGVEGMLDDALRVQERRSRGGGVKKDGDSSEDSESDGDEDNKPAVAANGRTTTA